MKKFAKIGAALLIACVVMLAVTGCKGRKAQVRMATGGSTGTY